MAVAVALLVATPPALAGPVDLAAPLLGPCPLFPGPGDPVYCSTALLSPAADKPETATLQVPPAAIVAVLPDLNWRDIDPYAIVFPAGSLPDMPPLAGTGGFGDSGGLGLSVSHSDDDSRRLSAVYDLGARDGLKLQSHGALGEAPDPNNSAAVQTYDVQSYDASSGLSVSYAAMPGVTLAVEPDMAVNWSDMAAGQTRLGVGNRLTTALADDLSLTLSAGYDSFFYAENPLQNYRALQQRIAVTWGKPSAWQYGLSASSRSEWSLTEERRIISPGLFVTMPLAGDVSLTARNDFGLTRSSPYDGDAAAREDYRNTFGLQTVWQPAVLSRHALRVMADYALTYDTALAGQSGLGDGVSLYETLARLAVAMQF
jgi:hypothetical protein